MPEAMAINEGLMEIQEEVRASAICNAHEAHAGEACT